jgi:hypothetical protein
MDALINNANLRDLVKAQGGLEMIRKSGIFYLDGITIEEYNGSFVDDNGTRQRFIEPNAFALVGEGFDVFDCPFAPVIDFDSPNHVGSSNSPSMDKQLFFSKSWVEKDPSTRWIKGESRPLPVLQRPDAVVYAKPVADA